MGFLDRLFGRGRASEERRPAPARRGYGSGYDGGYDSDYDQGYGHQGNDRSYDTRGRSADEQALERYRYMLRTAPPEAIEQAHQEAFAKLTPQQRAMALQQLAQEVPPQERARSDDPRSLARMATRAEMRQPGTLERAFGGIGMGGGMGMGGGIGMGGLIAGSLMSSLVGSFIGTAIAQEFFDNNPGFTDAAGDLAQDAGVGNLASVGEGYTDQGIEGQDLGAEDLAAEDFGGDFGDFGSEL